MKFNIAELDVWEIAEYGFEVNNVYRTDRYIDVKDTEVETLTEALKKWYSYLLLPLTEMKSILCTLKLKIRQNLCSICTGKILSSSKSRKCLIFAIGHSFLERIE